VHNDVVVHNDVIINIHGFVPSCSGTLAGCCLPLFRPFSGRRADAVSVLRDCRLYNQPFTINLS
jgi:hypothetical protein